AQAVKVTRTDVGPATIDAGRLDVRRPRVHVDADARLKQTVRRHFQGTVDDGTLAVLGEDHADVRSPTPRSHQLADEQAVCQIRIFEIDMVPGVVNCLVEGAGAVALAGTGADDAGPRVGAPLFATPPPHPLPEAERGRKTGFPPPLRFGE